MDSMEFVKINEGLLESVSALQEIAVMLQGANNDLWKLIFEEKGVVNGNGCEGGALSVYGIIHYHNDESRLGGPLPKVFFCSKSPDLFETETMEKDREKVEQYLKTARKDITEGIEKEDYRLFESHQKTRESWREFKSLFDEWKVKMAPLTDDRA